MGLLRQNVSAYIISPWKSIASDCFRVFSSETFLWAIEEVALPRESSDSTGGLLDQKEKKLDEDFFKDQPFPQLAAVYSEHWMQVLFLVDNHCLKDGITGGTPGSEEYEWTLICKSEMMTTEFQ